MAAITLNPKDADSYVNRSDAYYGLGNCAQSTADLQKALSIDPSNASAVITKQLATADPCKAN